MFFLFFISLSLDGSNLNAWGFYGHEQINRLSVFIIPKPLFGFYKTNINYMGAHAADADKRRYIDTNEACRHFLDGDHYEHSIPLDTIPKYYSLAIEKYGKDSIIKHGIVPWYIMQVYYKLIEAFKDKDLKRILKQSADLGHYIGDCHVPLHSTSNYNGQKSGQYGIHALWESRLTELNFDSYDLLTGQAVYLEYPNEFIWKAFERSYYLVDSVLSLENKISQKFKEKEKYSWEPRGNIAVKQYSKKFCDAYHYALNGMVEERLKSSIYLLGCLIYTAWVNAGQPILLNMPLEEDEILPIKEQMIGREEE
ncbi:MAG: S1/P1 Nuclease [Bacteroidia bacterium]|nr:S1/P1 Nuclease [Bacteroidia bacterium]